MILSTMWQRYDILIFLKNELTNKGYNSKSLLYISSQIELLDKLIKQESFNVLNQVLRKTNYRLLKQIKKGEKNLISICKNPEKWKLYKIEEHRNEWLNKESLIFLTEKGEVLVFTQNNYQDGQRYINNKWQ